MPLVDGIGHGELTALKISHLSRIFDMHLAVAHAVLKRHPFYLQQYRYIDLTSGMGSTPNGSIGSPVAFLEQAESQKLRISYQADFIEQNPNHLHELQSNISEHAAKSNWQIKNLNFYGGDYQKIIPALLQSPARNELGLVFVDPSGDLPDFKTLSYIAQMRPRMEILIYLSSTNIKRLHHLTGKLLSDYMQDVGKKHWLIRKPISWDTHKWTFLLGSGHDIFKNYKRIDFFRLNSEEAQSFFPKLNLSRKQRTASLQTSFLDECDNQGD